MNALLLQAIKKAGQIRARLKLGMVSPINIFDVCTGFDVTVRFVNVSMEGMYINREGAINQQILISSLRPFPRRIYTCAHELGHHIFGHGSKVDGLTEESTSVSFYDKDEYLVDAFAGAFLMPTAGIEAEFTKREWNAGTASAFQFYIISSVFGTGYSTLINHCKKNTLISDSKASELLKQSPIKILKNILGAAIPNSHFKIIDNNNNISVIDLETGNYLFLPTNMIVEGSHLCKLTETDYGTAFIAKKPGIIRATSSDARVSYFIRIQNAGYVGLAENRHLEEKI